ncbi:MAG: type II secretion system GspH family protein, partial [Sedimenticola sp.]|nr:type II secretion system GspH family protein [Sedimenticola sp.]
ELVVVILILSVLAATALPRFMDVQQDAHVAAVKGAGGGFGSAVSLAHAQWVANGSTAAVNNLPNFGSNNVNMNASGWPVSTTNGNANTATGCVELWNGIMQNPPAAATAAGTGIDYVATYIAGNRCRFTYQGGGAMSITYDTDDGAVIVDAIF